MSATLTNEFIVEEIRSHFGYPIVEFEAIGSSSNEIMVKTINRCLREINNYKPRVLRYSASNVETGTDTVMYVDLPATTLGIKKVNFVVAGACASENVFDLYMSMIKGSMGNAGVQRFEVDIYMERKDRLRILDTIFASQDDYFWCEEEKRLILYCPNGPKDCYIEYFVAYAEPTDIRQEDDQLFLDMVIARMKIKIGEVRRKYGGTLPSPGAVTIQLDGEDLVNEGREEWEAIMEKLDLLKLDLGILQR